MGQYDQAKRRAAVRKGRERGAWFYVPAVELEAAGVDPLDPPPFYRLWAKAGKRGPGTILVQLWREP